jgi:hypothetical protein
MNRIMLRAAAVETAMMLAAAGCKNDMPSDPEPKPVPVSAAIAALKTYLAGQPDGASPADPVPLELSVALSAEDTAGLFAALDSVGKYFRLDLSGCTGLTEWGAYTDAGKVVSLVLPDSVVEIAKGTSSAGTFASFGCNYRSQRVQLLLRACVGKSACGYRYRQLCVQRYRA